MVCTIKGIFAACPQFRGWCQQGLGTRMTKEVWVGDRKSNTLFMLLPEPASGVTPGVIVS